ncbi:MAG: transporter substrate-binding domain-containing protein, partial [Candidatus Competibacteraceae bacterium]|nr:transporter substrate-binding domain-containing protein [Candidatus Competibacteraceae bacterium]
MKKPAAALLLYVIEALLGASLVAEQTVEKPPLRVVMDNNYPPYVFTDDSSQPRGVLVDYWARWRQMTGRAVEITAVDWAEALRRMANGEFDVIDTIFRTPSREKIYSFSEPYEELSVSAFFHRDISGISSLDDLAGFVVGVKGGDAAIETLAAHGVTTVHTYPGYEDIIRAAKAGEIRVFVIDRPPALYFLSKYGLASSFRELPSVSAGEFHRAVLKGNEGLLREIEDGFARLGPERFDEVEGGISEALGEVPGR